MKNLILLCAASCVFAFSNCSKNDDDGPSRTELISSSAWKYDKAGIDVNNDDFIDTDLPPGFLNNCSKDNILTFQNNGQGAVDEGATKCDPADPQTSAFTWSFQSGETVINFPTAVFGSLSGDVEVVTLTTTKLTLSKVVNIGGSNTVNVVVEMKH